MKALYRLGRTLKRNGMVMVGKIRQDKIARLYQHSTHWLIRKNYGRFWYRQVKDVTWKPGVPPGIEEKDVGLL
jgi:hypothetical protein